MIIGTRIIGRAQANGVGASSAATIRAIIGCGPGQAIITRHIAIWDARNNIARDGIIIAWSDIGSTRAQAEVYMI